MFLPDKFVVQNIVVHDARPEISEQVKQYVSEVVREKATMFGKTNIFLVPRAFLEDSLRAKFPVVQTAQILRVLPSTVSVSVQEKIPVALLFSGGAYFALDPQGVAFEEVPADKLKENKFPLLRDQRETAEIELGKPVINNETISMLHEITRQLPDRFNLTVSEMTIPAIGTQELDVHTNEGWTLVLDATRPLDGQFVVLDKILTEEIDSKKRKSLKYIDLRVPGKAFYMYR